MAQPFLSASWYRVASIRLGLRSHVRIHRHRYRGRAWYVLQDPILGRSHRITPAAYAVVARMDGARTLDEIWTAVAALLAEEAPSQDDLIQLVSQLHGADLIQGDVPVDGGAMVARLQRQERSKLLRAIANPLSLRIPLWDPNEFLGRTLVLARPAIAWAGLAVWLPVVATALVLAAMNWAALTENLSDRILSPTSLALLALVYPMAKLLHELGHGYVARAFGAEVHEAGLMLLVGYPVPYVDASGASAFRSKHQRILVGMAGMLVEVFVAALALLLWLAVEPGLVRTLLFNVVVIAGVSTVLFNANPLLRYDGYYILSDWIEIPNFGTRANAYWSSLVERRLFGADIHRQATSRGERWWYLAYGPASYAYRLFIGLSLALFVATQFFFVGAALAIWSTVSILVLPVARGLRHVLISPRLADSRRRAVAMTVGGLAALLLAAGLVPLPLWTHAEGVLWLPETAQIRARGSGFVRAVHARSGTDLAAGSPVLELEDVILAAEIDTIRARFEEAEVRYTAERFQDRAKAEVTRIERDTIAIELDRALDRQRRLTTASPVAGRLVVPTEQDLPGRFVREGEVVAYVVPDRIETIRTSILQDDVDLVRANLRAVRVRVAGALDRTLPARVARAVPAGRDELPSRALGTTGGGQIGVDPRDNRGLKTLQRSFQLDLQLAEAIPAGGFGARAYIRFEHEPEPAARQIYRRIRQLFLARFDV